MTLFQPDSVPIFARQDRAYHYLESCASAKISGDHSAVFEGIMENGKQLTFVVDAVEPHILRIRYNATGGSVEHETPFTEGNSKFAPPAIEISENRETYLFETGAISLRVSKSPWRMSVSDRKGKVLFQQEIWDKGFVIPITYSAGYSEGRDGDIAVHESFSLSPDEQIFGLGPKCMSVNKRGHKIGRASCRERV